MRRHRPLHHPLEPCFEHATASLTASLGDGSVRGYQATFRSFLRYLAARHPKIRRLRAALRAAAAAAGITARLVPHQARHTYASEMLRAGVSLIGVMKLLGHSRPEMTMQYLKITLQDLQHEYRKALANSPHLVPSPRALPASSSRADLPSLLDSLDTTAHILEMFRRALPAGSQRRLLGRMANRIAKIIAQLRHLNPPPK